LIIIFLVKALNKKKWERLLQDENMPFLNRVIGGRYPMGSTIKPLIAAAALEEEIISGAKRNLFSERRN